MVHDLRTMLRLATGRHAQPSAAILDSRPRQSSPESGHRAGYDGAKRKRGSTVPMAVDTLGHLLALHVTPANEQDRAQVAQLTAQVQDVTGESVAIAFVDQGYTGAQPAQEAVAQGIRLEVVKLQRPRKASSSCPAGGWRSAVSAGPRAFAAWPGMMNDCRQPWQVCIFWPSRSYCSSALWN